MSTEPPNDANSSAKTWREVRACFEACLEANAEQRIGLLIKVEAAVRDEVAELLRQHEDSAGQLEPERWHPALMQAACEVVTVGNRIGDCRIVRVLGRGGMGTVYLAEQEAPRRHVAIKLLATNVADDEAQRRFQLEAELLGRLHHPGIAQIYEVGVHEEQTSFGTMKWPYFAMEYIADALTLAEWARAQQHTEQQLLAVFLQICSAVQHAHERGVVHRDLKPQNVLIDTNHRVKVIDFGIARSELQPTGMLESAMPEGLASQDAVRQAPVTQPGDLIGTLHYMAPEQIRGDSLNIDTRTDVHALGLVLYELLTGKQPFDFAGKSLPEIGQILCEQPAPALRQARDTQGRTATSIDLELIVQTALAKEPARRYAQAGSLAEDLERYLQHEPIRARAPSLRYQLKLFARRRRGLVTAVAALLLVATVGGVSSLVYAIRAQQAEGRAVQEGEQKLQAMQRVFRNALHSVINLPRQLEGLPGATKLRNEMIARAVQQLEFVEQHAPLNRSMRLALARAYFDVAGIQGTDFTGHVGDREAALRSLDRAQGYVEHVLRSKDVAADSAREPLVLQFDIEFERMEALFEINQRSEQGAASWQRVETLLAHLVQVLPKGDAALRNIQAACAKRRGHIAMGQRDPAEAVRHFEQSRDLLLTAQRGQEPSDHVKARVGALYRFIAVAEKMGQRNHHAKIAFAKAVASLKFVEQQPNNLPVRRLYAMVRTDLGYTQASQGKTEVGEAHMRWSHQELERQMALDADNVAVATSLAAACNKLSEHIAIQGKYAESKAKSRNHYQEAKQLALRGLELARPLRERSRDMMNIMLVAECERVLGLCNDALR